MEHYYIFVLASRHHRYLSVGATGNLTNGVKQHRDRISRRLGKTHVFQKLIYVERVHGVAEAVARQQQLVKMNTDKLRRQIQAVNPGLEKLSLKTLSMAGFATDAQKVS